MSLEVPTGMNASREPESANDIETRYLRDGRDGASFEDVVALLSSGNTMPAQAMAEGGYSQFSEEQNKEIARKVVEGGIDYLMQAERGGYEIGALMQVITRAGFTPEETIAYIQKLSATQANKTL